MRYYPDSNGVQFHLEKSGIKVYEDRYIEHKKKNETSSDGEASSSFAGLLSTDARVYFDDSFGKCFIDNQVKEYHIMGHIEALAKEEEEGREKIREELKVSEARVMAKVFTLKGSVKYI